MRSPPARVPILLLTVLLTAVALPRAQARGSARKAKRHFQKAEKLFAKKSYRAALKHYRAGYRARRLPEFLFNIGQCYRHLGRCKVARRYFKQFIRKRRSQRAAVVKLIKECPPKENEEPAETAEVAAADGDSSKPAVKTETEKVAPADVEASRRAAELEQLASAGRPAPKPPVEVETGLVEPGGPEAGPKTEAAMTPPAEESLATASPEAGSTPKLDAAAAQAPPDRPAQETEVMRDRRSRRLSSVWFWTAAGAAVALLASGAALGIVARQKHSEYRDPLTDPVDRPSLRDSGQQYERIGLALVGVGIAAAASAGVLAWLTWSEDKAPVAGRANDRKGALSWLPVAGPGVVGIGLAGRF